MNWILLVIVMHGKMPTLGHTVRFETYKQCEAAQLVWLRKKPRPVRVLCRLNVAS